MDNKMVKGGILCGYIVFEVILLVIRKEWRNFF